MSERKPREWQIRVCACGREQLQGELGAGVCWHHWDPDGEQFLEMDRVYTVEGPPRPLRPGDAGVGDPVPPPH